MTALNNQQWEVIASLLPKQSFKKGGRPRSNDRLVLEGIIWILKTGAQWAELPPKYGHYSTCWRRLKRWSEDGTWDKIWKYLLKTLKKREKLSLGVSFLDATFAPAKKGDLRSASLRRVKGLKLFSPLTRTAIPYPKRWPRLKSPSIA